jgi:hypothetical protein
MIDTLEQKNKNKNFIYVSHLSPEVNHLSLGFGAKRLNIEINATVESSMEFKKLNS